MSVERERDDQLLSAPLIFCFQEAPLIFCFQENGKKLVAFQINRSRRKSAEAWSRSIEMSEIFGNYEHEKTLRFFLSEPLKVHRLFPG